MTDAQLKRRTLWLCTVLHGFTHLYQVALIPLYLLIQKDLGLAGEEQATFLVTALSIAYFLPSYPMGMLADRVSRRKLLTIGLALNASAYVGLSFAPTYAMAIVCVMLAGLGGSFYHPAATALIARLFPSDTGKALGKVGIGASMGFFFAPLYAGWRAETAGWRQPVLELGVLGLVAAAAFWMLAKDHPPANEPSRSDGNTSPVPVKMFATPMLWFCFLAMSLAFCFRDFAGSGMATLGSLFLQKAHGFDARQTGIALSLLYLASIISNPLFGHLSDRGSVRWTTLVLALAALFIFIFPRVSTAAAIPSLVAYGFFFMASFPMVEAALMQSVHDTVRGRVFGFFITVGGLLGNLSHWFIGTWVRRLGETASAPASYFGLFNLLAVFVLISLAGLAFLHVLRQRDTAQTNLSLPTK